MGLWGDYRVTHGVLFFLPYSVTDDILLPYKVTGDVILLQYRVTDDVIICYHTR